jgi:hypothetical protein
MNAAEIFNRAEDDLFGRDASAPDQAPAAERLETALGSDLTRFLLSALAGAQAPPRAELS